MVLYINTDWCQFNTPVWGGGGGGEASKKTMLAIMPDFSYSFVVSQRP